MLRASKKDAASDRADIAKTLKSCWFSLGLEGWSMILDTLQEFCCSQVAHWMAEGWLAGCSWDWL
jgi:hypothetical protein